MNQELKEQAHKEFDEKFTREIEKGYIDYVRIYDPSEMQKEIKDFIDSLIDKTVQMERERIVGVLEKTKLPTNSSNDGMTTLMYIPNEPINREINERIDWVISIINNKSDINKDTL